MLIQQNDDEIENMYHKQLFALLLLGDLKLRPSYVVLEVCIQIQINIKQICVVLTIYTQIRVFVSLFIVWALH